MRVIALLACFAISISFGTAAQSQDRPQEKKVVEHEFGTDHFAAGNTLRIGEPIVGDLFAAGGSVDVDAAVSGDAVVAGGKVRIGAPIGMSVYAAGGQVTIDASVARSARLAGGHIELSPKSEIAGNVTVGGGQVSLNGTVRGYVRAAGGRVFINGPIGGDVLATAGNVELGPDARIAGKLRYASGDEIKRDTAAQVTGGIERIEMKGELPVPATAERSVGRRGGWVWTIGLMALAAVLVGGLPDFYARVAQTLQTRPWFSLLIGFVALVCIPVAAIVLLITIIGIPLALLTIVLYLALLLVGYASTGVALGDWVLKRFKNDAAASLWWRVGAAMLAVLVIALVSRIPFVGGFVVLAALLIGMGALALQVRRRAAAA